MNQKLTETDRCSDQKNTIFRYLLIQADTALIHGQRLAELCSKGPELEVDIALSNFGLDYLGQARFYYQLAAEYSETPTDEDRLAYFRDERKFLNSQPVELPNKNFAYTIVKQYFLDEFQHLHLAKLCESKIKKLAGIASKAIKENAYHLKFSTNWLLRLGDGTKESRAKAQEALNYVYPYTFDFFTASEWEKKADEAGIGVNPENFYPGWFENIQRTLEQATLKIPETALRYTGGKTGKHTENLGYILAEMQFLQRSHPNLQW